MFKKILVAVDGSEIAAKALETAEALAAGMKGELLILTVEDSGTHHAQHKRIGLTAQLEDEDEGELLYGIKMKMLDSPVPSKVRREIGKPSEVILEVAKETGCDAIVMGSRGLGGLTKLFIGSVSSEVLNNAEIPVVVVK